MSLERIAVLKAEIRGLQTMVDAEITARLKAEAETAALRAQLDAARWRPVTEDDPPIHAACLVISHRDDWPVAVYRVGVNAWERQNNTRFMFNDMTTARWRPLPPAPDGEEAQP